MRGMLAKDENQTLREIVVNDKMQQGYRYVLTAPTGRDFDPEFEPELTPQEMLELGVFAGKYMTDCRDEFPAAWFEKAKLSPRSATLPLISSAWTPRCRSPNGRNAAGSTRTTLGDGSNGTAATSSVAG